MKVRRRDQGEAPRLDEERVDLSTLLDDLPRGRRPGDVGAPPSACFESPQNLLASPSLRIDLTKNVESKLLLGWLGGRVNLGDRLVDGRVNRWITGGRPIGIGDDRHHLLISQSRGGKGRGALIPILLTLPAATSVLCIDPKGDLARLTARYLQPDRRARPRQRRHVCRQRPPDRGRPDRHRRLLGQALGRERQADPRRADRARRHPRHLQLDA